MGVNGVQNANTDLSIYKKLNPQQGSTTSKPSYMTKEGSLWNAPGVKDMYGSAPTQSDTTIHSKNTGKETPTPTGTNNTGNTSDAETAGQALADKQDANAGRAAAKDAQGQQAGVRESASESQQNTSSANSISADAIEISKQTKKANQQFKANSNKQNAQLKQTNNQINTITQNINTEQAELDSMNNELDSLLNADKTGIGSHSAFSLNLAGTEQTGGDAGDTDMAKIQDLQARISQKGNVIKMYNTQVTVLTKQSNASLRSLERTNAQYVKSNQKTQKAAQSNQAEVSGFMKTANKANEIAVTVTNIGTTVKYAGMALIAMGAIPFIGAGLAAAGQFMKPIGESTEAVGQFGQTAANVMLAAGNIAEGNVAGALTNIATAVQTGASAVASTKSAKADFKEAFKQADGAGKAAEATLEKSEQLKQKAETKTQESSKKTTTPTDNKTQTGAPTDTKTPNNGIEPAKLETPKLDIPDKIEIKEGSPLDKFNKQQQADMMKNAKKAARKQEANAAWKELQADVDKFQKALTAFGPSSSNQTSQPVSVRTLTSAEKQKYIQLRESGVGKNTALQIIYGQDYNNFMAVKKGAQKQAA